MAPHSSVLAWRVPGMGEPGGLPSMGSHRVRHGWSDLAAAARLVIAFLPKSKRLLISWLQSPSAVILEPAKIKSATVSIVSPSICYEVMGQDVMTLVVLMTSFKPAFSLSSFTFIKRLFSFSSISSIRMVSAAVPVKSRQSCPTLCDPIDSSSTGSSVPGILQARILE